VHKSIFNAVKRECIGLCSTKEMSALRRCNSENLATFSFETLNCEFQKKAPLLHGIIQQVVKGSSIGTVVTTATALRFRNRQLSAFHHVVAQILDRGGATDEVYLLPTHFDHLNILFLLLFLQCKF